MSTATIPAGTESLEAAEASVDPQAAARRQAFVDAAREAFFARGYAGTTMSSIASKVGGSKTTLWSYFPSKEELFAAVVDDIVSRHGDVLAMDMPLDEAVLPVLRRFADTLLTKLMSEPLLNLYRLVVGEAERFPYLAETFYNRGPRRGKARAALWVKEKMARGELRQGDPLLAMYQFSGMLQAGLYQFAVLNLPDAAAYTPEQRAAEIDAAVDTFYRAWKP